MLFNSIDFLIFFPIVLLLYYVINNKRKNLFLLIASYYFYMSWNAKYLILLIISTIITFFSGILLEKNKINKKIILFLTIFLNLVILFYFKYFNFGFELIKSILSIFNISIKNKTFDILLPVGISFYIFQALSYTIDVYRKKVKAEKNFVNYALFVSFFPQLVAGPIERSKNLLNQFSKPKKFEEEKFISGLILIIWGLFLKIVLADRMSLFIDIVYNNYSYFSGMYLIVATILFAFQLYCDFYGYSVIARGSARMLGVELMDNFKYPYLSTSVKSFWKRWHISLTTWFKDYLYVPLGGNRKGKIRTYINILIVFLLSGLWHGADLSFVMWGVINGFYYIIGDVINPLKEKINSISIFNNKIFNVFEVIITFLLIDFSYIFFRSKNIHEAFKIIISIFKTNNFNIIFDESIYYCRLNQSNFIVVLVSLLILLIVDYLKYKNMEISDYISKQKSIIISTFIIVSVCIILIFGIYGPAFNSNDFIYFQF